MPRITPLLAVAVALLSQESVVNGTNRPKLSAQPRLTHYNVFLTPP